MVIRRVLYRLSWGSGGKPHEDGPELPGASLSAGARRPILRRVDDLARMVCNGIPVASDDRVGRHANRVLARRVADDHVASLAVVRGGSLEFEIAHCRLSSTGCR